ncbi:hypothetical protein IAT38_006978 [Cryptococcus sp. DSM 104549]
MMHLTKRANNCEDETQSSSTASEHDQAMSDQNGEGSPVDKSGADQGGSQDEKPLQAGDQKSVEIPTAPPAVGQWFTTLSSMVPSSAVGQWFTTLSFIVPSSAPPAPTTTSTLATSTAPSLGTSNPTTTTHPAMVTKVIAGRLVVLSRSLVLPDDVDLFSSWAHEIDGVKRSTASTRARTKGGEANVEDDREIELNITPSVELAFLKELREEVISVLKEQPQSGATSHTIDALLDKGLQLARLEELCKAHANTNTQLRHELASIRSQLNKILPAASFTLSSTTSPSPAPALDYSSIKSIAARLEASDLPFVNYKKFRMYLQQLKHLQMWQEMQLAKPSLTVARAKKYLEVLASSAEGQYGGSQGKKAKLVLLEYIRRRYATGQWQALITDQLALLNTRFENKDAEAKFSSDGTAIRSAVSRLSIIEESLRAHLIDKLTIDVASLRASTVAAAGASPAGHTLNTGRYNPSTFMPPPGLPAPPTIPLSSEHAVRARLAAYQLKMTRWPSFKYGDVKKVIEDLEGVEGKDQP